MVSRNWQEESSQVIHPRQLWPADISRLRMELHPRLSAAEAASVVLQSPGASYWIPESEEFIIVAPWRHRQEIATVHTFGAFANEDLLMQSVISQAQASEKAAFVVVDLHEVRSASFYLRHGLEPFEEIVTYSHRNPASVKGAGLDRFLQFRQVDHANRDLLEAVIDLDHRAFPWFWWNSEAEFDAYLDYPGVEVWAAMDGNQVMAYAGITRYRNWAHLDRIATEPGRQGTGVGREMLSFVVQDMARKGARSVALSTQGNNQRSRSMYERAGFVHTPRDDYGIHLVSFNDELVYSGKI
jgi:ribosomal protein S18 acetylase RimI-like enzyme